MAKGLTKQRQVFVNEYLKDFNGTRAAIAAGYSERSARQIACKLLTITDISDEISKRIDETCMTADEIIMRLSDIARGNVTDLMDLLSESEYKFDFATVDSDGNIIPKDQTKLIKKIKQKKVIYNSKRSDEDREEIFTEIELYSAQDALNTLAKYRNLLTDKVETSGEITIKVVYDDNSVKDNE
jgi:phage terminase small subunit